MSAPVKTVSGAYAMALLGIVLGVVGMQRFYVRRYISGGLMTAVFVVGLFVLTSELILHYYSLLGQLTDSLAALSANQYGNIPDITARPQQSELNLQYGYVACAVGGVWWLVDLALLPGMVNKFNRENAP